MCGYVKLTPYRPVILWFLTSTSCNPKSRKSDCIVLYHSLLTLPQICDSLMFEPTAAPSPLHPPTQTHEWFCDTPLPLLWFCEVKVLQLPYTPPPPLPPPPPPPPCEFVWLCDCLSRVLSFPWTVPFSWARCSLPALTWPRSDRLFQAPAAAGLLSRPSLFLLEPGRRYGFFPRFPCFTKALWTILEYFEIWLYLVKLSIFKFILIFFRGPGSTAALR